MDADALIGRQPGTSTLQRVIGSGTLGAVYLAHQSQPSRQVAVKVLLRLASLEVQQQRDFLAIFRHEMASIFSLQHPHVVPVYDYGDLDGLAYIVMPYIAGETLEDVLVREGALPLQTVASYLQQIAAALAHAHAQGIVHRDLKPANILITPEKRVFVTDFHLTSMLVEGKTASMRLAKPGLLDYMSPELVIGKQIDSRADLYSLGVLLYRMVTGVSPFQGQTLMKVATKHLKMPPPSPRAARPDLPPAAEQVILKALAKNPAERFEHAVDMSLLFRQAINGLAPSRIIQQQDSPRPAVRTRFSASNNFASGNLASDYLASNNLTPNVASTNIVPTNSASVNTAPTNVASSDTGSRYPGPPLLFGPKSRTSSASAFSDGKSDNTTGAMNLKRQDNISSTSQPLIASTDAYAALNGQMSPGATSREFVPQQNAVQVDPWMPGNATLSQESMAPGRKTWTLPEIKQDDAGTTGTYKLTGPARIVNIPVAGQPGQYVTGILPASQRPVASLATPAQAPVKASLLRRFRTPIFALVALLIVCGSLSFAYIHSSSNRPAGTSKVTSQGTPNVAASATARAQASLDANTILSDTLSQNIRGWPESTSGSFLYQFRDGAYHIANNDANRVATAILPGENLNKPFVYTLTMDEIRGDDASINNESGMILRFNAQVKNGKQIITFYTFEVVNNKGGAYQFWKYDNSSGPTANPWKQLSTHPFGSEFHQGQGPRSSNTLKILVNGKNFTLIVNGKQVWSVQDGSLVNGQVGMLVNLKGTEVAFSNLNLTWN